MTTAADVTVYRIVLVGEGVREEFYTADFEGAERYRDKRGLRCDECQTLELRAFSEKGSDS